MTANRQEESSDAHVLASIIRKAWSARSPSEQAQFIPGVSVPPAEEPSVSERLLDDKTRQAEIIAALSGAIDPQTLASELASEQRDALLARLAPDFERTVRSGSWVWTLSSDRRSEILEGLSAQDLSLGLFAARNVATDRSGDLLRLIAAGAEAPVETEANPIELQKWVQALSWSLPLRPQPEKLAEARRRSTIAGLLAGYEAMLADGFFGRDRDLQTLQAFIIDPPSSGPAIPMLPISGVGGSGKSTLLAAALGEATRRGLEDAWAPIIVHMDFDRRRFLDGGEVELWFELTRRLALFAPAAAPALAQAREDARRDRQDVGAEDLQMSGALETTDKVSSQFGYAVARIVRQYGLSIRPLVIVVDTFEEWQRGAFDRYHVEAPEARLFNWIAEVRRSVSQRLAVVVCGRAPAAAAGFRVIRPAIELGDLKTTPAIRLLRSLGLEQEAARRLHGIVGGNPLSLKLAARAFMQAPPQLRVLLLDETENDLGAVSAAVRQGLLYRRILDHIEDEDARRLAHPGLALRHVTPELIAGALAIPCGLGPITLAQAEDLHHRLASEVWLVERSGERLVHRPEVRAVMLRLMAADPDQADRLRAVHAAAVDWYTGPGASNPDAEVEAAYHRLALTQKVYPELAARRDLLERIASSLDEFSLALRAEARDLLGRSLTEAEAALLPEDRRRRWLEERVQDLVRRGQPERALELWSSSAGDRPARGSWFAQALFEAVRWRQRPSIELDDVTEMETARLKHHFLLAVCDRDRNRNEAELSSLSFAVHEQLDFRRGSRRVLPTLTLENLYFYSVAVPHQLDPDLGGSINAISGRSDLSGQKLTTSEWRRICSIADGHPILRSVDPERLLIGAFNPTPSWIEALIGRMHGYGLNVSPVSQFYERFSEELAHGRTYMEGDPRRQRTASDGVLTSWARRFADVVLTSLGNEQAAFPWEGMIGLLGDAPEWRSPIRLQLSRHLRRWGSGERFASLIGDLLEAPPWDLTPQAWMDSSPNRSPTKIRALVEYIDRCGRLPDLMRALSNERDMGEVAEGYLRWRWLEEDHLSRGRSFRHREV